MTIQLSVLIWTVICFCLLIVILQNLLFKPLFFVMDKRNEKIERAKESKRKKQEERQRLLSSQKDESEKQARVEQERCAKHIAQAHKQAEKIVNAAKAEQYRIADARSAELLADTHKLGEELDNCTDKLVDAYISKLLS